MASELATWINEESEKRRLSLREIASRAGVSHTTVIRIANDQLKTKPSADVCFGLARALGVPPQRVFRIAGYPMPPHIIGGEEAEGLTEIADYYHGLNSEYQRTAVALIRTLYEQRGPYAAELRPNDEED